MCASVQSEPHSQLPRFHPASLYVGDWCNCFLLESAPERKNQMTENGISHYCLSDISGYFSWRTQPLCLKTCCEQESSHWGFNATPPPSFHLPPQNHRAAYDIEQNCHPRQPGSHYSDCIYPSTLRKSAFIRPFYRWSLGSLLGMDTISCAVIIKSQHCSNSSVRLYFDRKLQMPLWATFQNSWISTPSEPFNLFYDALSGSVVLIEWSHTLLQDL